MIMSVSLKKITSFLGYFRFHGFPGVFSILPDPVLLFPTLLPPSTDGTVYPPKGVPSILKGTVGLERQLVRGVTVTGPRLPFPVDDLPGISTVPLILTVTS